MKYLSVEETAQKWNISARSVRNYCAEGRVPDAVLEGKTWRIPENAVKPARKNSASKVPLTLLEILADEKKSPRTGGIYHKLEADCGYG